MKTNYTLPKTDKSLPDLTVGSRFWCSRFRRADIAYVEVVAEVSQFNGVELKVEALEVTGTDTRFDEIYLGDSGYPGYAYDNRPCLIRKTREEVVAALSEFKEYMESSAARSNSKRNSS